MEGREGEGEERESGEGRREKGREMGERGRWVEGRERHRQRRFFMTRYALLYLQVNNTICKDVYNRPSYK